MLIACLIPCTSEEAALSLLNHLREQSSSWIAMANVVNTPTPLSMILESRAHPIRSVGLTIGTLPDVPPLGISTQASIITELLPELQQADISSPAEVVWNAMVSHSVELPATSTASHVDGLSWLVARSKMSSGVSHTGSALVSNGERPHTPSIPSRSSIISAMRKTPSLLIPAHLAALRVHQRQ